MSFVARPVHHLGFNVPDLRAAIDTWVVGAGPGIDAFFDTIAAGARDWDGRDPIRGLG